MFHFLRDQVCLVTGGTQGIGWAITQALADRGGRVYACGYSQESLTQAETERPSLPWGDRIHLSRCDVTNRIALAQWIDGIYEENGRIDVLVNNAAFVRWQDVADMPLEDALYTMRVSYDGMVTAIKRVLPQMQAAGRGHIVNIGSITGRVFVGGASAAYSAAKAAVDAYTQILQVELQGEPVNATLIRLGTVAGTNFFKKHVPVSRMPRFTSFMPALTPPQVATAVVQAIKKKRAIVTLPRYLGFLTLIFQFAPRFSRWLVNVGFEKRPRYDRVEWRYKDRD